MTVRNNDKFKKEMTAFWGLPSFGENVKNGWDLLGFIGFNSDFMTADRPNAKSMPFSKTTTVPSVNSPVIRKNPKTLQKTSDIPAFPESMPASPARQAHTVTPARYTHDARTDKLTVTDSTNHVISADRNKSVDTIPSAPKRNLN